MTKGNDTLKVPGQTRDRKRQKNNGNNHNRVRLIIGLKPYAVVRSFNGSQICSTN